MAFFFDVAKKIFYEESKIVFAEHSKSPLFIDITRKTFGRLTVLGFAGQDKSKHKHWFCKCECGNLIKLQGGSLKCGDTISCGCFQTEKVSTHRHSINYDKSPTYITWDSMIQRCQNPNNTYFEYYGGRGIKVCDRWESFENFLEDMGERPNGKTLDRYPDKDGDYCPPNCRWATRKEQANNRRSNRWLAFNGKKMTVSQWADELKMNPLTLRNRLNNCWSVEKALTTPVRPF